MAETARIASKNGVDGLSGLPDAILCYALSFLDTKYAVATSVLSTRWKNLYLAVPDIVFDDSLEGINRNWNLKYERFALKQITVRNIPYINRFRLHYDFNLMNPSPFIQTLVCAAIWHNVKELDICVTSRKYFEVILPAEVFTCRSLVVLELKGSWIEFDVPELVRLPNLKELHLEYVRFANSDCMRRLFEGCKLLEDLLIFGCKISEHVDVVDLSFRLLRNLIIKDIYGVSKLIIDTPKLEFFEYEGHEVELLLVNELKYVHTAKISFRYLNDQAKLYKLINKMHGVKSLYISKVVHPSCYSLPVLEYLTRLELCVFELQALSSILESSPQLQELVIPFPSHCYWSVDEAEVLSSLPKDVPFCLVKHLKSVVFKHRIAREFDFELVKYFLQNGKVLERLKFGSLGLLGTKALLEASNRISMLPKTSAKCEILFVHN